MFYGSYSMFNGAWRMVRGQYTLLYVLQTKAHALWSIEHAYWITDHILSTLGHAIWNIAFVVRTIEQILWDTEYVVLSIQHSLPSPRRNAATNINCTQVNFACVESVIGGSGAPRRHCVPWELRHRCSISAEMFYDRTQSFICTNHVLWQ